MENKKIIFMKKVAINIITTIIIIISLTPFFDVKAASLSTSLLEPGVLFDIYGSGFGSSPGLYGYVCFGDDSHCYGSTAFAVNSSWRWTESRITLAAPSEIPVSGDVMVYVTGTEQECYDYIDYCYDYSVSKKVASIHYDLQPWITGTNPETIASPGERITIEGFGFGDGRGSVYFDSYKAQIINWSSQAIDVIIPSSILKSTNSLKVISTNGLSETYDFTVGVSSSSDPYSYLQDYLEDINLQDAWAIEGGGQDVVVAVIDDGVYINHPDLVGNIWTNQKELPGNAIDDDKNGYVDDVFGWDFVSDISEMTVRGKHGTMVAGIIGAVRNNNIGIAGITNKVKLMSLIVGDSSGYSFSNVDKAIRYATDNGADIINLSLGTRGTIGYTTSLNAAIEYAYSKGVVLVVSAGNGDIEGSNGQNVNTILQSPISNSSGKHIMLGVAALANISGDSSYRTGWSNYGSNYVNIAAPGEAIVSTAPPLYSSLGEFYDIGSGTSFSAPMVSGVAAMLKSKFPSMPNWEIINRIVYSAYGDPSTSNYGGRLDAANALKGQLQSPSLKSISPASVSPGDKVSVFLRGFTSDTTVRLIGTGIDLNASNYITVKDPTELTLTVPPTLANGAYNLSLYDKNNRTISSLSNALTVSGSSSKGPKPGDFGVAPASPITDSNPLGLTSGWLIKNHEFVEVFYVDESLCLSWIVNEQAAERFYGPTWNYAGVIQEFSSIPAGYQYCDSIQ